MTRIALVSFVFALSSVACSVETTAPIHSSDDSSQDEEESDGNETTTPSSAGTTAKPTSDALPAPKLLPEGPVKTVNACTTMSTTTTTNIALGSGHITRTTRQIEGFHGVGVGGSIDMVVTEGSDFAVQIEADDNLQDLVTTTISAKGNLIVQATGTYCTNGGVRALVTMPKIDNAAIDGSGTIEATKLSAASKMTLGVMGSGALVFHGAVDDLGVIIEGSGTILLSQGSAKTTKAVVSGSGAVTAKSFPAGAVTKQVDGSGIILL